MYFNWIFTDLEGKNYPHFLTKIENGGHCVVQACKLVTTYLETDLLIVSLFSFFLCYLTKAVHQIPFRIKNWKKITKIH